MAAASILDFRFREILLADNAWRAQLYHCAIFRHTW